MGIDLHRIIWGAAVVLGMVSLLGLAGGIIWQADLFVNHFRVQLLIASFVLAALAAVTIGGRAALAALAVLVLNATLVGARLFEMAGPPVTGEGEPVRILTVNLLMENTSYQAMRDFIAEQDADILVLQEFSPKWSHALEGLGSVYPHEFLYIKPHAAGMAVYAKQPFTAQMLLSSYHDDEWGSIHAVFEAFTLYAAHPKPPVTKDLAFDNHFYLETLAELSNKEQRPVVIAGDFNATPWSRAFGPLVKAGFRRSHVSPFAQTFPRGHRLKGIEIDHILVKDVEAARSRVMCAESGSDHCAVVGDVWVTEQ